MERWPDYISFRTQLFQTQLKQWLVYKGLMYLVAAKFLHHMAKSDYAPVLLMPPLREEKGKKPEW